MWCWERLWHDSLLPTSNLLCFILCHADPSKGNQILLFLMSLDNSWSLFLSADLMTEMHEANKNFWNLGFLLNNWPQLQLPAGAYSVTHVTASSLTPLLFLFIHTFNIKRNSQVTPLSQQIRKEKVKNPLIGISENTVTDAKGLEVV